MNPLQAIQLTLTGCISVLALVFFLQRGKAKDTRKEAAEIITRFLENRTDAPYEWDDFICIQQEDRLVNQVARECANLPREFPPEKEGQYCNEKGLVRLRELRDKLLAEDAASTEDS